MANIQGSVPQALLRSGKQEFLEHGFEKASLRTICKNANVTTGAFYTYFDKKEDLFHEIVCPVLDDFQKHCQSIMNLTHHEHYTNGDSELKSIEFLLRHKDEFILLFDCSKGTQFEHFQSDMLNGFMLDYYQQHLDFHVGKQVDPELVRLLLRMKFEEYMQILYGNYSLDEVKCLVGYLTTFTEAGVMQLIKELRFSDN